MYSKIKYLSKKRVAAILIAITFLFILLLIQRNYVKADDNIITYEDKIKILEIEPGNKFILGDTTQYSGGKKVEIKHATIAQFISMVDEIDGQYDAVVIGRKNDGLKTKYSKGTPYRDYTNPFNQQIEYLPLSTWSKQENWKKNYDNNIDYTKFAEYYSENDITKKRADEILNMIKKNQLIYMEDKINSDDIKYTKLYSLYNQSQGTNLIKTSKENITVDNIVASFNKMNSELKRPKVTKLVKPIDDKNTTTPSEDRTMKFTVNINDGKSEKIKLRLYLDINADGLFKDNELVETYEFKTNSDGETEFTFNHDLDKNFIGYLDWKIEVTKENGIKTNLFGNSKYKSLIGPKEIRVLQIVPDELNLMDLSQNKFIKDLNVKDDYDLTVQCEKVSDVNAEGKNFKLNGKYDMVIIGIDDSYGFKELCPDAINELEAFIGTGQSVMFTHDTITPALANSLRPDTDPRSTGPSTLTQRFRDYVGQARYNDPYRGKSEQNFNDVYQEDEIIRDEDDKITKMSLKNKTILHDYFFGNGNLNTTNNNGINVNMNYDYYKKDDKSKNTDIPYSLGTTLQGHVIPVIETDWRGNKYISSNWDWNNSWDYISKVKKINNAQINEYPFELGDTIDVALTHTQWYQLNLEDPDVVPWFNLNGDDFDTGDSRNFYYTYSKGNITYSGTGHSGYFTDDEQKLFINTMVKAERGANHAPIIKCSIQNENTNTSSKVNQIQAERDYYFSIDADDYEKDIVNMHVTINGEEISKDNIVSDTQFSQVNINNIFEIQTSNSNRTSIKLKIPGEHLKENGKNIDVVVEAEDIQKAKSTKKYSVKPVKALCSMDAEFISATPNPSEPEGNIDVKYRITPNDYYYNNDSISSSKPIDEAVFLIDRSQNMSNNQRFSEFKNGITKILYDPLLRENTKFGLVGYNSSIKVGDRVDLINPQSVTMRSESDKLVKPLFSITTNNECDGFRRLFMEDSNLTSFISNTDARNLDLALKMGDNLLTQCGEVGKKKAIIILSSGNITYTSEEATAIRNKGYKIITLDISGNPNNSNIKNAHLELGGDDKDYFNGKTDGGQYNDTSGDMERVRLSLVKGVPPQTNIIKSAKLNFDLGSNFYPINDKLDNYEQLVWSKGTSYGIDLTKKITYTKTNDKDGQGRTKYVTKPFEITFKVKSAPGRYGNLGFSGLVFNNLDFENDELAKYGTITAQNNNFIYEDVNGITTNQIKTPVIKVNLMLEHGVYNKLDEKTGKAEIINDISFPANSIITFASNLIEIKGNSTINLKIDDNLEMDTLPTLYVYRNGKLDKIKDASGNSIILNKDPEHEGQYKKDNIIINDKSNIVVLYSVKRKAIISPKYTNYIWINNGRQVPASIKSSDAPLPELF